MLGATLFGSTYTQTQISITKNTSFSYTLDDETSKGDGGDDGWVYEPTISKAGINNDISLELML